MLAKRSIQFATTFLPEEALQKVFLTNLCWDQCCLYCMEIGMQRKTLKVLTIRSLGLLPQFVWANFPNLCGCVTLIAFLTSYLK